MSEDPSDRDAPDDVQLMLRVKGGDLRAFEDLVERHQHRIVGTVAKMLGDDTEAEDVAQQVFVRVWQSAARYTPEAKFTTWLLTITRNLVFNEMRRRRRSKILWFGRDDEDNPEPDAPDTSAPDPAGVAVQSELERAVDEAIAALPEQQRMAVILRRYEEMSYEEIAAVLRTSVPSVKSLLFRARTELKERLARHLA